VVSPLTYVAASAVLAVAHMGAGRIHAARWLSRGQWLSLAGGVSVAYVFVHLFPELRHGADHLRRLDVVGTVFLGRHVFFPVFVGFVVFYGLERLASRSNRTESGDEEAASDAVFWIHVGSFAAYNFVVGYTLHHQRPLETLALFTLALAVHFVVTDDHLREHHEERYRAVGQWVVSAAVVGGTLLSFVFTITPAVYELSLAFLAGGIVLNVMTQELPDRSESRFASFLAGAAGYTALLAVV
jgi:zinc transporter ZupT